MGIVVLSHSFGVLYVTVPKNPNRISPSGISRSADCLSVLALLATTPEHVWWQKKKEYHLTCFTFPFLFSDLFSLCLRLFNFDPVRWEQRKAETKSMLLSPCMSRHSMATISAWSEMDSVACKLKCCLKNTQYFDYGSVILVFSAKSNYFTDWLLKIASVQFSSGYGFWTTEEIIGKHRSGAKLQKLRCSQQSATIRKQQPYILQNLPSRAVHCARLGLLICKVFSCKKNSIEQEVEKQRSMLWNESQAEVSSLQAGCIALAAMN